MVKEGSLSQKKCLVKVVFRESNDKIPKLLIFSRFSGLKVD